MHQRRCAQTQDKIREVNTAFPARAVSLGFRFGFLRFYLFGLFFRLSSSVGHAEGGLFWLFAHAHFLLSTKNNFFKSSTSVPVTSPITFRSVDQTFAFSPSSKATCQRVIFP